MTLEKFHFLVGETIMYCQIIEHDIKMIYAAMRKGDMKRNFEEIRKWTLGETIENLKNLDFKDGDAYISSEDYEFLFKMSEKRNHWCHCCYVDFVYEENFSESKIYEKECRALVNDNKKLSLVYRTLEEVRLQAMRDFNRM